MEPHTPAARGQNTFDAGRSTRRPSRSKRAGSTLLSPPGDEVGYPWEMTLRTTPAVAVFSALGLMASSSIFAAPAPVVIEKVEMEGGASGHTTTIPVAAATGTARPGAGPAPAATPRSPVGPRAATSGPIQMKQSKSLHIWLKNRVRAEQPDTTIRYWICGRDMKTSRAVILDGGEEVWKPGPAGTKESAKEIISSPVSSNYQLRSNYIAAVPMGMARPGARPGGAVATPIPTAGTGAQSSEGVKIIGHAVQVIQYDKIISEDYIEPSLKELVGSKGTTPGPAFQKKEEAK